MCDRDFEYIDQGSKRILHFYFIIIVTNTVILYKVYVCMYICMYAAYEDAVIGMTSPNTYAINFYGNVMFCLYLSDVLPLL